MNYIENLLRALVGNNSITIKHNYSEAQLNNSGISFGDFFMDRYFLWVRKMPENCGAILIENGSNRLVRELWHVKTYSKKELKKSLIALKDGLELYSKEVVNRVLYYGTVTGYDSAPFDFCYISQTGFENPKSGSVQYAFCLSLPKLREYIDTL
jgi:hypothetical protein